MIQRAFRYSLHPTEEQSEKLCQTVGAVRFVYNLALEQRRDFWRQYKAATGGTLNFISQGRQLTELRAEISWLAEVHGTPLTNALRDLDKSFSNFWAGRARYPTARRKGINDSFRFKGIETSLRRLNGKWMALRVPKIGWVKFRDTRAIAGRLVNVTVSRRSNQWFVIFATEIEHEQPANGLPAIGIDRGIANTLALSNGEMLTQPCMTALERHRRRAQRALSRRKRGSSRYGKQRCRVARIAAKLARARRDWRHRVTTEIARRFGSVAIEALRVKDMVGSSVGKRGLNRSIMEHGWGEIERMLAYKLEERGGTLIKVNPAYTSQECSACGAIDKASRESQASFACRQCGFAIHADTNAAINILRRSAPFMLVKGTGYGSAEARTDNLAA